tara:strand:+ start:1808 stop:2083 length:276 start_codon:yes stop_codon:yes gene_type:complete
MKHLQALITELENNAKSDWAIKEDMASMYTQDANDATVILNFITHRDGVNIPTASQYLNSRETSIREAICVAIAEDKGNDFLVEHFGWSVK